MAQPIRWDNVSAPSGISANIAMNQGIANLMASMDAGVDAMNAPQDARIRNIEEQFGQGKLEWQDLNRQKSQFDVDNQQQKFDVEMARNALLNQKTRADLTKSKYDADQITKSQDAFKLLNTPEALEQTWTPSSKEGESGSYSVDAATALLMKNNPDMPFTAASTAAENMNTMLGDTRREAAAADELKQKRAVALKRAEGAFKGKALDAQLENIDDYVWFSNDENRNSARMAVNNSRLNKMSSAEIATRLANATVSSWMGAPEFDIDKYNAPLESKGTTTK